MRYFSPVWIPLLSISLTAAAFSSTGGSSTSNYNRLSRRVRRVHFPFGLSASSSTAASSAAVTDTTSATSTTTTTTESSQQTINTNNLAAAWEDLEKEITPNDESDTPPAPLLTFYRDTNGWCPFCERVWICMRAKNIPYQERLVSLSNKPDWYKEMVPTTQVPALLFHNSNSDDEPNSRKLVWESLDIMKALDHMFPETPQLVLDTDEYDEANKMNALLNTAGFGFIYASRGDESDENSMVSSQHLQDKKQAFLDALDELERAMVASGGPFRLGNNFTGVDAEMIPSLERWRYQLPLSKGLDILENRPALLKWFQAMDSYAPFSERVAGDEYSWVATSAMFARFFGKEGDPETIATIERSESAAMALVNGFKEAVKDDACEGKFALEAAAKVISNREAIAKDCTNSEPKSQQNIPRAANTDTADKMLYVVAKILLHEDEAIQEAKATMFKDMGIDNDEKLDASNVAKAVASRLCAPRDMSAPAAKILRAVLMIVAERLEE
eukprot:scaffold2998_cov147-Chaetoceros_neogracile.AAC.1